MSALTLSRAEYLVILDILHANHILGIERETLFPVDRETHINLIEEGVNSLLAKGWARIDGERHIIERRLLELGAVVTNPELFIMTIRDRVGLGGQLYLHYLAQDWIIEQVLPDDDHYTLGQLPDLTSAMDRIVRLHNLPFNNDIISKCSKFRGMI